MCLGQAFARGKGDGFGGEPVVSKKSVGVLVKRVGLMMFVSALYRGGDSYETISS